MITHTQLPLAVQLPDDETFTSFFNSGNQQVVKQLTTFVNSAQVNHGFYLSGVKGSGKSHLLHACCALASELGLSSVCLSLSELKQLSVDVLEGLERIDLVCLDDLQFISEQVDWQNAVFDLFNRMQEHNKRLIVAGEVAAAQLSLSLPDLQSRLRWGESASLKAPGDDDKHQIIQLRAKLRGITISDEVCRFLLTRFTRDMTNLISTLDILDRASIREQRKITIPFIKDVLN